MDSTREESDEAATALILTMKPPKKIHRNSITGEKGINLIQKILLDMGFLWYPSGGIEGGVDGWIEIRNAETGEITNSIVQVQSKATQIPWSQETETSFEYLCDERDIDYWIRGNAPIILVVSRPTDGEAYWVSLKDYFRDPIVRRNRKVFFDKQSHRFDEAARQALIDLAIPADSGIYLSPPRHTEQLYSNLIEVTSFFDRFYVAPTEYRNPREFIDAIRTVAPSTGEEWVLRDKMVYSPHDLTQPPWNQFCDSSATEDFSSEEFAYSKDKNARRLFVHMLNGCLQEMVWHRGIGFNRRFDYYYFKANDTLKPKTIKYQAATNMTEREVFLAYQKDGELPGYYRHSAFWGNFKFLDENWYLEVEPTYHYTSDGYRMSPDPLREALLRGIKKLEKNPSLLGQMFMWSSVLGRQQDLFAEEYPFLSIGTLQTFTIDAGIDDGQWRRKEDEEEPTPDAIETDQIAFDYET